MKPYFFLLLCMGILGCYAQHQDLDGKTFTIDNYIGDQLDNQEDIRFEAGKMEGSVCVQYGFPLTEYKVLAKNASGLEFTCTMYSDQEGKMVWKGKTEAEAVEGTCLWTKAGQDPILFTFKGTLKADQ